MAINDEMSNISPADKLSGEMVKNCLEALDLIDESIKEVREDIKTGMYDNLETKILGILAGVFSISGTCYVLDTLKMIREAGE